MPLYSSQNISNQIINIPNENDPRISIRILGKNEREMMGMNEHQRSFSKHRQLNHFSNIIDFLTIILDLMKMFSKLTLFLLSFIIYLFQFAIFSLIQQLSTILMPFSFGNILLVFSTILFIILLCLLFQLIYFIVKESQELFHIANILK